MLEPHPLGVPTPTPTEISTPFWDGCRRHELRYQRCDHGHVVFDPASRCRTCTSDVLTWETSAGVGHVYSYTTIWRAPTPAFRTPYVAAIVELEEGYCMLANIVGCNHDEVSIGMSVGVEFHPISDAVTLPYFSPPERSAGVP
jgi:uncharacterized OB-fold protein